MTSPSPLQVWKERLAFLQEEEAKAADSAAKFKLWKDIEEAQGRIAELEGERLTVGQRVAPSRLTHVAEELIGREAELARLDEAWEDPKIHVVTIVAWGGTGKTSLVAEWAAGLAARDYDGADYFDWSFYSQGAREQGGASADSFVGEALRFFGDPAMAAGAASPWDKGTRLAQLVAERRTLLILDGLEPLQNPPGSLAGQLKEPSIVSLLKGLAQRNVGLCLVTTRERVSNLAAYRQITAPEWELERLSTPAGVLLLKRLSVWGSEVELEKLVEEVRGHALTLNLVGSYLCRAHGGDVRKKDQVDLEEADAEVQGGHAFKAMGAYESWLEKGGDKSARKIAILRLMGLFDRPADDGCMAALRRPPAIAGLTEPLIGLGQKAWRLACSALREAHLLTPTSTAAKQSSALAKNEVLDAHPLVRQYFAQRLRERQPKAWLAANSRLFEHLRDTTEYRPGTLEGLQPLYQAVTHGCEAGRPQEACSEVYLDRILRGTGDNGFYSMKKLGALGADLGALSNFFEVPWSRVSQALTQETSAWLLSEVAFRLGGLGRMNEALESMRAAQEVFVAQKSWKDAASCASNLSELELILGNMPVAALDAKLSVTFADRSGALFQRMFTRTGQADTLHQAGRRSDALEIFREAEQLQAEDQSEYPMLYSLWGFRYCDLLLSEVERAAWRIGAPGAETGTHLMVARAVEERALTTLRQAQNHYFLLDIALDHLTLGRSRLYQVILEEVAPSLAIAEIDQAVDRLRVANDVKRTPRGLLTRAWLRALQGNASGARTDLDEAQEIAERGPMPLHLADIALYRARLFRDREALGTARKLIEKHGYWRRKEELEDAEEMAKEW